MKQSFLSLERQWATKLFCCAFARIRSITRLDKRQRTTRGWDRAINRWRVNEPCLSLINEVCQKSLIDRVNSRERESDVIVCVVKQTTLSRRQWKTTSVESDLDDVERGEGGKTWSTNREPTKEWTEGRRKEKKSRREKNRSGVCNYY